MIHTHGRAAMKAAPPVGSMYANMKSAQIDYIVARAKDELKSGPVTSRKLTPEEMEARGKRK